MCDIDADDQGLILSLVQRKFVVSTTSDYVVCAANLRVDLESNVGIVCLIDLITSLQVLTEDTYRVDACCFVSGWPTSIRVQEWKFAYHI